MPTDTSTNRRSARGDAGDLIARAFARLCHRSADDPLVVGEPGRVTPRDIDTGASAIAAAVRAHALRDGAPVALAVANGPVFLAAFLALRRLGHPVLLIDRSAPVADRTRAATGLGAAATLECTDAWSLRAADVQVSPTTLSRDLAPPPGTAAIKLTSGSTGTPRGVAVTAEQLLADESALASTMGFTERDRLLAMVPMSHSYGFTTLVLSALVRGLPLIVPADTGPLAPVDAARRFGATVFPTVPAYVQALLRLSAPPPWPSSLRRVITAGAVLHAAPATAFRRRYGRPVHVFYGSSECGGICYDREGDAAERGTVGSPVDGVRVALASDEGDHEGLVTVSSRAVGLSYFPDPEPRLANGTFQTSDIAVWNNGELSLRRRVDGVINVRGRKVDPAEVERVLLALDGIDDAVVVPDAEAGGHDITVRAIVACMQGGVDDRQVRLWCQSRLGDHKVPRRIVFVDAIPRTTRGKLDRAALDELIAARREPQRPDA